MAVWLYAERGEYSPGNTRVSFKLTVDTSASILTNSEIAVFYLSPTNYASISRGTVTLISAIRLLAGAAVEAWPGITWVYLRLAVCARELCWTLAHITIRHINASARVLTRITETSLHNGIAVITSKILAKEIAKID